MQTGLDVRSDAFDEGGRIPQKYTCDGADVSPPLSWSGAPDETQAYALLVTDTDARNYVHWAVTDIPSDTTSLAEGASGTDIGGTEGVGTGGQVGWAGPCPPSGEHQYVFTVYALDARVGLEGTPDAATIRSALEHRVLSQGQLTAKYGRP